MVVAWPASPGGIPIRTLRVATLVLVLLAAGAPGAALPVTQNDAGSGQDAPSGRAGAILIAAATPIHGLVTPPVDPSDWYAFDALAGDTLRLRAEGTVQSCVSVRSPSGGVLEFACPTVVIGAVAVTIEIETTGRHYVEFRTPTLTTDYWLSYTLDGVRPPSPTDGPVAVPQDDAGSGRDAPDSPHGAPVLSPGVAYEGNATQPVGPYFVRDALDTYAFTAQEGDLVDVRAAGTGSACVEIVGPAGERFVGTCGNTYALEAHFAFYAESTGVHQLTVESVAPQSYRFSLGIGGAAPALTALSAEGPATATRPGAPPGSDVGANAVLALIDDGINPYHVAFRDTSPRAYQHPSTYIAGFPEEAVAINITFGIDDLEEAVEADCAEWEKVEVGSLYWFPGTRIVGAITFPSNLTIPDTVLPYPHGEITCESPTLKPYGNLVGSGGHGTMTASRAAGATYGACPECLIVMVQGFGAAHVRWAGEQSWIDAQSNSWGPVLPAYTPTENGGVLVGTAQLARAAEEAAQKQLSFWAAGNGLLFRYGVLGHPTQLATHLGPSAIRVGATDSGRVALWGGGSPHVASDGCDSWAASFDSASTSSPTEGGGTSAAAPFVAGTAARAIREARAMLGDLSTAPRAAGVLAQGEPFGDGPLADGVLTQAELRRALFATADPRPAATYEDSTPCEITSPYGPTLVAWPAVPAGAPQMPLIGYGAVTRATGDAAIAALRGEIDTPERPVEDAYFEADTALRTQTYEAWSATAD